MLNGYCTVRDLAVLGFCGGIYEVAFIPSLF